MKTLFKCKMLFLSLILVTGCKDKESLRGKNSQNYEIAKTSEQVVPSDVSKKFREMYPNESDPDWHQDDNGNWEAQFKKDGENYRADFKPNGRWIETENSIKSEGLSANIKNVIEKDFSDYEITEVEHVRHHSRGEFYDVEFKRKGKNRDVEFRVTGEIIN